MCDYWLQVMQCNTQHIFNLVPLAQRTVTTLLFREGISNRALHGSSSGVAPTKEHSVLSPCQHGHRVFSELYNN